MDLRLDRLNYSFKQKPLLVGGKAMEYYGLRKSGQDIDLIVAKEDILELIKLYPNRLKDLWGDLGVCPLEFEIWRTINLFDYDYYKDDSLEKDNYLVVSLKNLLFMKVMAYKKEKYLNDAKLIVKHIVHSQGQIYRQEHVINRKLLGQIKNISYIEKRG